VNHRAWEAHLSISRKVETQGRNNDGNEDPAILDQQRGFIATFAQFLPPTVNGRPARILAPGAIAEALLLAEAGYEVHALVLGPDNVKWLEDRRGRLPRPELLHVREHDAHTLDYPRDHFDGYFSCQIHEHWLAPLVHIGEARMCMRDGAHVFVDACGHADCCKMIWHTNLVPERVVREQWEFWGFEPVWTGPHGDQRPQFIFRQRAWNDPEFKNSGYLQWVRRLRSGERVHYAYTCTECGR